jgi:hypothetical protein
MRPITDEEAITRFSQWIHEHDLEGFQKRVFQIVLGMAKAYNAEHPTVEIVPKETTDAAE